MIYILENSKYSLDDIINEIMYILKTGIPY